MDQKFIDTFIEYLQERKQSNCNSYLKVSEGNKVLYYYNSKETIENLKIH